MAHVECTNDFCDWSGDEFEAVAEHDAASAVLVRTLPSGLSSWFCPVCGFQCSYGGETDEEPDP